MPGAPVAPEVPVVAPDAASPALAVVPPPVAHAPATSAPATEAAPSPDVASAESPSDLFDADALRRLRDLDPRGENRLFERVSKAFEASAARLLPQLDEAVRLNDRAAILHVAHTLKSSSASIGALKLSHLCAEIETMIRRQSEDDLSERLRAVPVEVNHVLAGLRALLEPSS